MKKLGNLLIQPSLDSEIVIGNTALVRAMIESGVEVVTTYPGSPTPEIAAAINSIDRDKLPFYFEFSVNEKVATEVAFGASINGHLSCVFFKSVGLNVAADSFVQLPLLELIGGMVIILGDDPGANSSQNEQDNLHFAKMSYMPVLEPCNPQESYEFFLKAVKLSKQLNSPVILRMTTHVCHAKEKVFFGEYKKKAISSNPEFSPEIYGNYIPITSKVFPLKKKALKKLEKTVTLVDEMNINKYINNKNSDLGIICFGLPYLSVLEEIDEMEEKPDILKLGMPYPLPDKLITDFLKSHSEIKIIEELDNIIEKDIKAIAFDEKINSSIIGKKDLEDWIGEYTPEKVEGILKRTWPDLLITKQHKKIDLKKYERPAQMCPGCGHRSAFYAIKKALKNEDITVADIGCHTLGFLKPYEIGQVLLCMGHSNGTASGLGLFNNTRKVIAFLGDSTFFHAGIPGIVNSIYNNHKHTLIVMENGTTAMTGHQEHAGDKIPIRKVLEGLGVENIYEIDTYRQKELTETVKKAIDTDSFNVIIARHPCMLKFMKIQRRKNRTISTQVKIGEKCVPHFECISNFACPSFQISENDQVTVNEELCIGDRSCMQTCPVSAIVPATSQKRGNIDEK